MKKLYLIKLTIILLLTSVKYTAIQAQNFKVIDINKITNSRPANDEFSTKNAFAYLNGFSYFTADDGIHGSELWRTDGTSDGTTLVKDVNPGVASSNVGNYDITASGGKLYFSAFDGVHGAELWMSDGTDTGTSLVADIIPGSASSNPAQLTDVNGILFFATNNYDVTTGILHNQLWKTDMSGGTILVSDFTTGFGLNDMVNVSGRLFFTFYDYYTGPELYTSDGTPEGTHIVKDINPYSGSYPAHLTSSNGLLYFAADDGTGGKLWVSDGTPEGTNAVFNIDNISLPIDYNYGSDFNRFRDSFAIINNVLYFQGISTDSGNELCKYDPTAGIGSAVTIVKDIVPGANSSYPSFLTNVNGTLFFTIGPAGQDAQLWKSNGTNAGTVLVKDISPGGNNFYYGLTNANGVLFFAYGNNKLGTELWKSDGTSAGTKLIKDINPGMNSSYPQYIAFNNGLFLFGASDGTHGYELWKSNGTASTTVMIKNINRSSTASSYPFGFTSLANNKTVFTAYNEKTPTNLYVTDGTSGGTKPVDSTTSVRQIFTNGATPGVFINFKKETYFIDFSNFLWKTDGTKAGTSVLPLPAFANFQTGYISNTATTENLLYLFAYDYTTGQTKLWRTDGTADGTYLIKSDLYSYYNVNPTAVGNTLFFVNYDSKTGAQLWKTDGTPEGTVRVKSSSAYSYNPPDNLYNFKGKLYFSATSPTNPYGPSLWSSDGTDEGTKVVKDIAVTHDPFAEANGKFFFYALDAISQGVELFASDGTASGTKVVRDINSGSASSFVNTFYSSLISGDTTLYFLADDGKHGPELWKSDGTNSGTKLVRDITPGINGTYYYYDVRNLMVNVHDNLFFAVNGVLWQSDGSKVNTHPVNDNNLKDVTGVYALTAVRDSLYFSGYTYKAGQELYVGSAKINKAPSVRLTVKDSVIKYAAPAKIILNAIATDVDGTIAKVEFYKGTTLLHTEHISPYDFVWIDVPVGTYALTAKVTDNSGNVNTSNSIKITVVPNNPPTVSIINPANNQVFGGPTKIHFEASAKDADGSIAKVEFFNGSTLLTTEHLVPYTFDWENVQLGNYSITAKATDNSGAVTTSAAVNFSVTANNAPSVSIINPANGESYTEPATINFKAVAKDPDGSITKVEFFNGTTLLTTEHLVPYTYQWQNVAAGAYTITAIATDNNGLQTTSLPVTINVTSANKLMARNNKPSSRLNTQLNATISLKLAPNPVNNILNIYISGLEQGKKSTISVVSVSGAILKTIVAKSNQITEMDVSSLKPGTYFLRLLNGSKILSTRFVKL